MMINRMIGPIFLGIALFSAAVHSRTQAYESPIRWSEAQKPIAAVANRFAEAFSTGDLKTLESLYADDARLITLDGDVYQGRESIVSFLEFGISNNPGISLRNDIRGIRLIGDSVAIENGFTQSTTAEDKTPQTVAYYMVYVKRDGGWKIFDVIESDPSSLSLGADHAERLAALDPLVGHWVEEGENQTLHHHVSWSPNHTYLLFEYFSVADGGKPVRISTQRVGWDASSKTIRSWLFEEDGGHGSAIWSALPDGKSWLLKASGVMQDGAEVTASVRISQISSKRLKIENYDRTIAGKAMPDSPERILSLIPPAPSASAK